MAFRVRCPRCGQTAEITEDLLGRQGKCNNCGAMVAIPARLTKVCFDCGTDVTNIAHRKDQENNYLCLPCFQRRTPAQPPQLSIPKLECSICHIQFPQAQAKYVQGRPVCRECGMILAREEEAEGVIPFQLEPAGDRHVADDHHGGGLVPQAPAASAATMLHEAQSQVAPDTQTFTAVADSPASFETLEHLEPGPSTAPTQLYPQPGQYTQARLTRPRKPSRLPLLLSSLAFIGVIAVGAVQWTTFQKRTSSSDGDKTSAQSQRQEIDLAEHETITRLLVLKGQAEVLIEVGKAKEGIHRYDTLLRLANGKTFKNPDITAEVANAKIAREQAVKSLAAAATTTTPNNTSAEPKPPTNTDPATGKPRTIFDE